MLLYCGVINMQITMFPHMYTTLFNHVSDAIKALEKGRSEEALEILIKAQQET